VDFKNYISKVMHDNEVFTNSTCTVEIQGGLENLGIIDNVSMADLHGELIIREIKLGF
jgi:hypothetical protein